MLDKNLSNLISISFVGGLIGSAFQYLLYLIVGRYLGAEPLGLFTFGIVILNISATISRVGLDKAVKKYIPIYRKKEEWGKLSGLIIISIGFPLVLGSLVSIMLYLNPEIISNLTSESFGSTTSLFLLGIPFMTIMTVGRAATTGFIHSKYAVYIKDVGQSTTAITLVAIAAVLLDSTQAVIIGYVLSIIIAAGLALYYLYTLGVFRGINQVEFEPKMLLTFSIPLTIAAIAQYLVTWTDVLMLGMFRTASEIGTYQAAFQTSMILGFLLIAANSVFPSIASGLYDSGELNRLRNIYAVLTKWVTYFTLLGYIFIVVYPRDILLIFGSEFTGARLILMILSGVFVLSTAVGPAGFLLMMANYERVELLNTIITAVTNVVLNYLLIQQLGVLGAAIATGISLVVLNILRISEVWWIFKIRPKIRNYGKGAVAIAAATPIMFIGHTLSTHFVISMAISGILSLFVFCIVMYLLGPEKEDYLMIQSLS
ncbi:oligosaccharide flippase family protein [Haloferax sp. DFSO52]|uniref:oligosaccharide flippase family protein n=1 Tax=Haloferax sp. DFSO52 TaxID=3388505 RepID=UPI003A8999DB